MSRHEIAQLLDEDMTEEEVRELTEAEMVCRAFLAWDIEERGNSEGVVKELLGNVLKVVGPDDHDG